MQVLLLGPVAAAPKDLPAVGPGPRKQRVLLALLGVWANRPVSVEQIIDELWPVEPPPRATSALQVYVSQLRKIVGADAIRTVAGGYVLDATTDVDLLHELLERGQADLQAGKPTRAFHEALNLWRGEALSGLRDSPQLAAAAVRFDEDRMRALEGRIDVDLASGLHDAITAELAQLTSVHPLREGLWVRRIIALYRQGRQSEALECVSAARAIIADELGADPSPELVAVESAVRTQAASLRWRPLAADHSSFFGREQDLVAITAALQPGGVVTVTGPGGVGKTRIARHVQQTWRSAVWFVDLSVVADDSAVVGAAASQLGVREVPGTSLSAAVEAWLKQASGLVIFDNAEHVTAEVTNLVLLAGAALSVLVTSRRSLSVGTEVRLSGLALPGPDENPLESEAVRLFCARAATASPGLALSVDDLESAVEVCRGLDGVPLAIELAAARIDVLSIDELARRIADVLSVLTTPRAMKPNHHASVRATLMWSHEMLSEVDRSVFRRIGVFTGPFRAADAEAVCAMPPHDVMDSLQRLKGISLLESDDSGLRLLDTVRALALELLSESGEDKEVRARHLSHLTDAGASAPIDDSRGALVWALQDGNDIEGGTALALNLVAAWYRLGLLSEGRGWLELARANGVQPSGAVAHGIGLLAMAQGDLVAGEAATRESLLAAEASGDSAAAARCLLNLAAAIFAQGQVDEAHAAITEALRKAEVAADSDLQMRALNNLAQMTRKLGDLDQAVVLYERALGLARDLGDSQASVAMLLNLGELTRVRGDNAAARKLLQEALSHARASDFCAGIASALGALGNLAMAEHDPVDAEDRFKESLTIARSMGDKALEITCLTNLATTKELMGDDESARSTYELAVAEAIAIDDHRGSALASRGLADVLCRTGVYRRAARELLTALNTWIALREPERIADCLDSSAGLAVAVGDVTTAGWMLHASDTLLSEVGAVRDSWSESAVQDLRAASKLVAASATPTDDALYWLAEAARTQ